MGVLIIKDGEYPEFTPEQEAMLAKLAAMDDCDIDTSDILHWLRQQGGDYQARLNAILRRAMQQESGGG